MQIDALAGFLDVIDFKYFCTFTTRKTMTLRQTRSIAENVGKFINAGDLSTYFWAAEPFDTGVNAAFELSNPELIDPRKEGTILKPNKGRIGYHFHALIRTPWNKMDIFDWYFPRYGRCDIIDNQTPERQRAASWYISKYITKELSDYDIYFEKGIRNREQINIPLTHPPQKTK